MKPAANSPSHDLLRGSALILSIATCLSLAACESGSSHGLLANQPPAPGNYRGDSAQPQTADDDETDTDEPSDDEENDNPSDVNRTLETAEADDGSNIAEWNQPATLGSVRGHVVDAVTGAVLSGTVSTNATCAGTGCTRAQGSTDAYVTPLQAGDFAFDADPVPPAKGEAKPALLTLSPTTSFTIAATGYDTLVIAHGPKAPKQSDAKGRSFTELPALYLCPTGALDSDVDGICDAAEAKYKTNASSKDEDNDALSDSLEFLGHPKDSNTVYDIRNLGADPHKRDIFIAVRYTQSSQHSDEALDKVVAAFAAAPPTKDNPAGGISLHIEKDNRLISGADDVKLLDAEFTTFRRLTKKYFQERPLAFHYALFADRYVDVKSNNSSSGLSYDFGAAEFIVTLGGFPNATPLEQAGTFMHELGHNLNLRHGGFDNYEEKPEYMSIMNYVYQFTGIERKKTAGVLDFSRIQTTGIDELSVDENLPFKPAGNTKLTDLQDYTDVRVWSGTYDEKTDRPIYTHVPGDLSGKLDLNLNGEYESAACIVFDHEATRKYGDSRDDWSTLKLDGGGDSKVGDVEQPASNVRFVDNERPSRCLSARPTGGTADDDDTTEVPSDDESPSDDQTTDTPPDDDDDDMSVPSGGGAGIEVPEPNMSEAPPPAMPTTPAAPMCYAPTKAPKPQKPSMPTTPTTPASQTKSTDTDDDTTDSEPEPEEPEDDDPNTPPDEQY